MGANLAKEEQKQPHMARDLRDPCAWAACWALVLFVGAQTADRAGGAPHFTEAQRKTKQNKAKWKCSTPLGCQMGWKWMWFKTVCVQMKCINLIIYQLAVSCGVGQTVFPVSWTPPVTEWRSNVLKTRCYLITALLMNSQKWCATADSWRPSGFHSSCQFFSKDKEEFMCKKQKVVCRVFWYGWRQCGCLVLTHPVQQQQRCTDAYMLLEIYSISLHYKRPAGLRPFARCSS